MALQPRMNTKNVSSSGIHVFVHFSPRFGTDHRIAHELDDDLEDVGAAGRHELAAPQVTRGRSS